MIIKKTREHVFRMGDYESLHLTATVEIDTTELDPDADAEAVANSVLDGLLEEDLNRADQSSKTPEEDTYLHAWKDSIDNA